MNLPPHLQNMSGMMFPNNSNIQLNNLSAQNGINPCNNVFTNDLIKIPGQKPEKVGDYKKNKTGKLSKNLKNIKKSKIAKKKWKVLRRAGGQVWEDPTLEEWPENDYRIFCGDLGNEVTDEILATAFRKYSSFLKARVIRDKRTGKSRGFGFVSLKDANDYMKAMKEMHGKYVGNRPIRLKKSSWKDRSILFNKSKIETVKFKKNRSKIRTKNLVANAPNNPNINNNLNPFGNYNEIPPHINLPPFPNSDINVGLYGPPMPNMINPPSMYPSGMNYPNYK